MTEIEITKDNWEAHYPIPETGDWEQKEARSLADCSDIMPKTLKEHQEKVYNACLDMAYKSRSELAHAVEEERKAWLQGIRCTECGKQNLNEMSHMCRKCLEEA